MGPQDPNHLNFMAEINGGTLPETNIFTPENGWLEYFLVSFWGRLGIFSGANLLLVSGRVILTTYIHWNDPASQVYEVWKIFHARLLRLMCYPEDTRLVGASEMRL